METYFFLGGFFFTLGGGSGGTLVFPFSFTLGGDGLMLGSLGAASDGGSMLGSLYAAGDNGFVVPLCGQ